MNVVVLMGRLTDEPKVNKDKTVAHYTLAVDRERQKGTTDFIPCTVFKGVDFVENYLHKGSKIAVRGSINTGSYEKNGQRFFTTEVVVFDHEFCERRTTTLDQSVSDFMAIPGGNDEVPFV